MKWMLHDTKRKELWFQLEEYEFLDDMDHQIVFDGPKLEDEGKPWKTSGIKRVNSEWILKFRIPDGVDLLLGRWEFIVRGTSAMKGSYITASGFSCGNDLICHQAVTKKI